MSGPSSSLPSKIIMNYPLNGGDFMNYTDFLQNLDNLILQCPRYKDILDGTAKPPTLASVSELGASYIADSSFAGGTSSFAGGTSSAAPSGGGANGAVDDILSDSLNFRAP